MYIRCWGSRGSIPVSGKEYQKYGGDTTCIEIRSKNNDIIIIDAGTGIRPLGNQLAKDMPKHINMIFTHVHWDHIMGFPLFKPLFMKKSKITVRCDNFGRKNVREIFESLMGRPFFPVQLGDKDIRANISFRKVPKTNFKIGSITVSTIPLSHPKDGGVGYRFEEDGKVFVFLTDNELGYIHKGGKPFKDYVTFSKNADLLIHDSEYLQKEYQQLLKKSEEPWGHSVLNDVIDLAVAADVKMVGLFHLNAMRTDSEMDAFVKLSRALIAKKNKKIKSLGISSKFEITL